eukprot:CAMPEP_0185263012 /NCGR_PEP_ID=MMETSP1359-20130426/11015_1 /TAXON_ID=552665 /ORGANISM="Bigelowiella longifila, Strain CCMP242" /LENGTH=72 /DNA_ID=CAMNT_0027850103 /DNA_START=201 /DNA_END=419 /DNA_ORIENTATION=+
MGLEEIRGRPEEFFRPDETEDDARNHLEKLEYEEYKKELEHEGVPGAVYDKASAYDLSDEQYEDAGWEEYYD